MGNSTAGREPARQPIRIKRCRAGQSFFFRTLEEIIFGIQIHWFPPGKAGFKKWHSELCTQAERDGICAHCEKSVRQTWAGYTSVQVADGRYWKPCVLELTGLAALDIQAGLAPGQIWEISNHGHSRDYQDSPIRCEFQQAIDAGHLPPPWDVPSVINRAYGRVILANRIPNTAVRGEEGEISIPTPEEVELLTRGRKAQKSPEEVKKEVREQFAAGFSFQKETERRFPDKGQK